MTGAYNRAKGHSLEREIASELSELFEDVMTARAGDRSLDNLGVDIIGCQPLGLQCHCSKTFSIAKFDSLMASQDVVESKGYTILGMITKRPHKPKTITLRWSDFLKLFREVYDTHPLCASTQDNPTRT